MRAFTKLTCSVLLLVFAILSIIHPEISTFVYILFILFAIDILMQLTADVSKGEEKLDIGGIISYVIIGIIGAFFFNPWWRGFLIMNALADSVMTVIPAILSLMRRSQ